MDSSLQQHFPGKNQLEMSFLNFAFAFAGADDDDDGGGVITVLPGFVGDVLPELVRVFPSPIAVATGYIVYHAAARDTARVRVVADALIDFFQTNRVMFAGS